MTENKLDVLVLREQLVAPNGPYAALDVVESTGSTNADLLAAAEEGARDRTVLVAGEQTAGRGRRDRTWASPPGSGVYLSVLVRPSAVPPDRLGTLNLVAGLALMHVATETAGIDAVLKWPNDLLVGPERAKAAGILSEAVQDDAGPGAVVGVGFNVTAVPEDAEPGPGGLVPGSFADAGAKVTDRTALTASFLRAFQEMEALWRLNDGDLERSGVLTGYREACASIGQRVRAELPDGTLTGVAVDVDPDGRLLVEPDDGNRKAISAGDIVHLRAE